MLLLLHEQQRTPPLKKALISPQGSPRRQNIRRTHFNRNTPYYFAFGYSLHIIYTTETFIILHNVVMT